MLEKLVQEELRHGTEEAQCGAVIAIDFSETFARNRLIARA